MKLDPEAVRRRASSVVGCIEIPVVDNNNNTINNSNNAIMKKKSPMKPFQINHNNKVVPTSSNKNTIVSFVVGTTIPLNQQYYNNSTGSTSNSTTSNNKNHNNKQLLQPNVDDLARVTIYCDTGTIATGRILNGTIRHTFRKNVTSLDVVERCLKYPAYLTKIDWQIVSCTDNHHNNNNTSQQQQNKMTSTTTTTTTTGTNNPANIVQPMNESNSKISNILATSATTVTTTTTTTTGTGTVHEPVVIVPREKTFEGNLQLCDVGLAILHSEKEKLISHVQSFTQQQQAQQSSSLSSSIATPSSQQPPPTSTTSSTTGSTKTRSTNNLTQPGSSSSGKPIPIVSATIPSSLPNSKQSQPIIAVITGGTSAGQQQQQKQTLPPPATILNTNTINTSSTTTTTGGIGGGATITTTVPPPTTPTVPPGLTTTTTPLGSSHPTIAPTSGMEFQFSLAERPMKHVDQCLTDIQKMNKIVHAVSTNGIGTVFLYGNGGVAYTPNIPRTLYQKLSQLRYSKIHSSRPQYVSLGSRERYFVAFHDGTVSYKGPKGLDKELRKLTPTTTTASTNTSTTTPSTPHSTTAVTPGSTTASGTNLTTATGDSTSSGLGGGGGENTSNNTTSTTTTSSSTMTSTGTGSTQLTKPLWPLRSVAFGSSYDTFCIVFQDGTYKYHGKNFPKELEEVLVSILSPNYYYYHHHHHKQKMGYNNNNNTTTNYSPQNFPDDGKNHPNNPSSNDEFLNGSGGGIDSNKDYPLDHYYNKKKADEIQKSINHHNPKHHRVIGRGRCFHSVPTATMTAMMTPTMIHHNNNPVKKNNSTNTNNKQQPPTVTCINLGPTGEWFLRTDDGLMEWGNISEEMDEAIQQLLDDGHRLNYFDFGEDSSYFVSYD